MPGSTEIYLSSIRLIQHLKIHQCNPSYRKNLSDQINRHRKSISQNPTPIHTKNFQQIRNRGNIPLLLIKSIYKSPTADIQLHIK